MEGGPIRGQSDFSRGPGPCGPASRTAPVHRTGLATMFKPTRLVFHRATMGRSTMVRFRAVASKHPDLIDLSKHELPLGGKKP